ncbi:MAG: GAF domain-containing protein [Thermodesulfobacteriota bacterium]|jgi:Tfp pilus assembly protein PilZ
MGFEKFLKRDNNIEGKDLIHIESVGKAFSQISSAINARKDVKTILDVIAREVLNCLKAQRSTIYFRNEKSGELHPQFIRASDRAYEQMRVDEEKVIAQKAVQQNKPLIMRKPEDFSQFSKIKQKEGKITSLMNFPLSSREKTIGVLSAVIFNGHKFGVQSLQFLSSFANHISIALEMARLSEEVRKANGVRQAYDRQMDEIVNQVQSLSLNERQRIDDHIIMLQTAPKNDEKDFFQEQNEEGVPWVRGAIVLQKEGGVDAQIDEKANIIVRVEFREDYWRTAANLTLGKEGAFIQMTDPMELGDQFPMMLYMPNGADPIEVQCKVTWSNKYGKETKDLRKGMGVKFLKLEPESKKRIEECVQFQRKNFELRGVDN